MLPSSNSSAWHVQNEGSYSPSQRSASLMTMDQQLKCRSHDMMTYANQLLKMSHNLADGAKQCRGPNPDQGAPEKQSTIGEVMVPQTATHLTSGQTLLLKEGVQRARAKAERVSDAASNLKFLVTSMTRPHPICEEEGSQTDKLNSHDKWKINNALNGISLLQMPRPSFTYNQPVMFDADQLRVTEESPLMATFGGKHRERFNRLVGRNVAAFLNNQTGGHLMFGIAEGCIRGFFLAHHQEDEIRCIIDTLLTTRIEPPPQTFLYSVNFDQIVKAPAIHSSSEITAQRKILDIEVLPIEVLPELYSFDGEMYMRARHLTYKLSTQAKENWMQHHPSTIKQQIFRTEANIQRLIDHLESEGKTV